jgi:hypothetical protein
MRSQLTVCFLLLSASAHAGAPPAARIGEAEVREAPNGVPCFTISQREERRGGTPNFDAVTVTDAMARRPVLWKMAMPRHRTFPVSFSMCIPYAGRVQALPQTPAAQLETGRVYQVRIDARPSRGLNTPAAYEARFCLSRQHGGGVLVHHIGAGDYEGRYLFGCLRPAD